MAGAQRQSWQVDTWTNYGMLNAPSSDLAADVGRITPNSGRIAGKISAESGGLYVAHISKNAIFVPMDCRNTGFINFFSFLPTHLWNDILFGRYTIHTMHLVCAFS